MVEQTHVSFRCPADILDAIKKATAGGTQRTTVITDALRAGLGLIAPGGAGRPQGLQGVLDRLADLEATTRQHEQLVDDLAQLTQRVRVVEDRTRSKTTPEGPTPAGKQPRTNPATTHEPEPPASPRLTVQQAFEALGGDPADQASTVPDLTGSKRLRYNTFRLGKTDYGAFGLEVDHERKAAGKRDWLALATRPEPTQAPTLFPLEGL
jgi:hypothetical protein